MNINSVDFQESSIVSYTDLLMRIETPLHIDLKYEEVDKKVKSYYVLINRDILPTFVDPGIYDGGIDPLRAWTNYYIKKLFVKKDKMGYINLFQPSPSISHGTECPRSRTYEFQLIRVPGEILYGMCYSQGKVTSSVGKLPLNLNDISDLLRVSGKWEKV